MKIHITNFAKNQIHSIYSYYKLAASIQAAQKIKKEINDTILRLYKFPESGHTEESLSHFGKDHRSLITGNFKIIYHIEGDQLFITDVFDTRQNPEKKNP